MIRYILKNCAITVLAILLAGCKQENQAATKQVQTKKDTVTHERAWPRVIDTSGIKLVYYQPQIDNWQNYDFITGQMAFSVTQNKKEVLGVASLESHTLVDKDARLVYFRDIRITDVRFPSLSGDTAKRMEQLIKNVFPKSASDPVSLDRLMADVQQKKTPAKTVAIKNDPPEIFFSTKPAVLLIVQGDPVLVPIENNNMQFVVNSNWDLFFDKTSKEYYLLTGNTWSKTDKLTDTWVQTTSLPEDMSKLPEGQNFDDVRKVVPPPSGGGQAPHVYFSNKPAELILVNGKAQYKTISGTGLSYISNTNNDVFKASSTGTYYVLLSGRWFAARSLNGPWDYAGNSLPAGFAKIPESSPKARVLTSVPGTQAASDAVMLAQVPTTAIVNKAEVEKKVNVKYDGEPQFKSIESTSLQYATNTQDKVIKDGDIYYLCFQAVWFMSTSPQGPWKTASSVPKEIYTIPPSSPVYNVTYVTQVETSSTTVESSSTAGYFGMFVFGMAAGAILTYGTGYYYPPYFYWGPGFVYPIYRPWPCTYGAGVVYNPWTGGYAAGSRVYGPYGAAGTSAWYNPATGRYGRSASVQGMYGGRTAASTYNPWTGTYAHTNQGHNPYAQWGSSVASNGNGWVQTGHVTTRNGTAFGYQTSTGKQGVVVNGKNGTAVRTNNGNVYAGHDGNVYRKNDNGSWSQYNNNNHDWNTVNKNLSGETRKTPTNAAGNLSGQTRSPMVSPNTMQGLNRSDAARQRGNIQTSRFQNYQRGGGGFGGGGHRGGGGGFRRR